MTRGKARARVLAIAAREDERNREHLARLRATARQAPRDERRRAHAQRGAAVTHARRARRRRTDAVK